MSRRTIELANIAHAVRDVAASDTRSTDIMPTEGPNHSIRICGEPGILWAEIHTGRPAGNQTRDQQANRLAVLGWRQPTVRRPVWHQYFHPTRKRHHRQLAEHISRTFEDALDVRTELTVASVDRSLSDHAAPTFATRHADDGTIDTELLAIAEQVLTRFQPDAFPTHLELTMSRKHHHVRVAVAAHDSTLTCCALHLPAISPGVAASAWAANDRLDRVAYTYATHDVRGHGKSLVLQSKISLLPHQRIPPLVGMLLYTTIEPLIDAHRELHR